MGKHGTRVFDSKTCDIARNYCLLGATDAELARFFDVTVKTIHHWKNVHPEFKQALEEGKTFADSRVAQALYSRAVGYRHIAFKMFHDKAQGRVVTKRYVEHYPPDTGAACFWLKNRQPKLWRDIWHGKHEVTGENGGPIQTAEVSDIEAARALLFALEEGKQAVLRAQKSSAESGNAEKEKEG